MPWRTLLLLASIFIVVTIAGFKFYSSYHRIPVHRLNADLQWLGLIDWDNTHEISLHAMMNGEDAILVMDHANLLYIDLVHKIPQARYLTLDELFSLHNLHLFDHDNDGLITAKDPIFKHLFIVKFYNKGAQEDIKSLKVAGIKAIDIHNTLPTGEHFILMNDGTQRILIGTNKLEPK